jgi:small subunit ribosomal protein S8
MTPDPIADMLTRLRNALSRGNETVLVPYSRLKSSILEVIKNRGLIENFEVVEANKSGTKKNLVVQLKYIQGKPAITDLKRVSKPGRRVYTDYKNIPTIKNNYGFVILSTSKGILDTFSARKGKLGGEIMCELY